jgi:hypothetical protein
VRAFSKLFAAAMIEKTSKIVNKNKRMAIQNLNGE